jgi:hypothetical protein
MGQLTIVAANPRVMVSQQPAAVLTDQGLVSLCTFAPGGNPQICVTTQWIAGATRVTSNGVPLLINPCVAMCMAAGAIPNGPPTITYTQSRVIAT